MTRRMPVLAQSAASGGGTTVWNDPNDASAGLIACGDCMAGSTAGTVSATALSNTNYFAPQSLPVNYGVSVSQPLSKYANPNLQNNIRMGTIIGGVSVGTVGALVALNLVGFPEAEVTEGAATFGYTLEVLTEPMSSMSVGFVTGAFIGGSAGGTGGYLVTPPFPY